MIYSMHGWLMDDNIQEKIRNFEEWNAERAKVKPFLDVAVDYHNKARREAHWRNFAKASEFYKEAIKNYKSAISLNPKYYLQDVLERIDAVIEEHLNNTFNLKTSGDALKTEKGVKEFVEFIEGLNPEERRYIDIYDIAIIYLQIAQMYREERNLEHSYEFYNKVVELQRGRPFLYREAYFNLGSILFEEKRFKEALIAFVSSRSFDRNNVEIVSQIERCLKELEISEHKNKFLAATPHEAKKLIMEVL